MSETTTTADTTGEATESATRAGHTTRKAAAKAIKDGVDETARAALNGAENAAENAQEVAHSVIDAVADTADAAAAASSKVAEQSREVYMMAARTAADVSGRVADIGLDRSHKVLTSTAHALDVYRDASERSAERVQALFASYLTLGRGWQQIQHAWLEIVDQSLGNAAHKPQDLLRSKTLAELAEAQRDLYLDTINQAVESSSRLLELAGRTAQDAVRPLQTNRH